MVNAPRDCCIGAAKRPAVRPDGCLEYALVVGPYGRDVLNDNGEHLVRTAVDCGMTIANMFFSTPKGDQQSTYVILKGDAWRLDYIMTRHADRRLIRMNCLRGVAC